jgi:hypothetical protein
MDMKQFSRPLRKDIIKGLISMGMCLFFVGCAPVVRLDGGTAAGISGYNYSLGKMTVIFQANFMGTWDGTLIALKKMELYVETNEHSLTKGKILAWGSDMTPVKISIAYQSLEETEVAIKVGKLGEKDASVGITEQIRKALFEA